MLKIKVKVAELSSEPCERTNVDTGSTTPPLSNVTQNLVESLTTSVVERGPPTPTSTETNNTQEANKGIKLNNIFLYKNQTQINTYKLGKTSKNVQCALFIQFDFRLNNLFFV